MNRRSAIRRVCIAGVTFVPGCSSLGGRDGPSERTVNPELDGTPTPPSGGAWSRTAEGLRHAAVYGDTLVTVRRVDETTRVTGLDPASGTVEYERRFDWEATPEEFPITATRRNRTALVFGDPRVRIADPRNGEVEWSLDGPADIDSPEPGVYYLLRELDSTSELVVVDGPPWSRRCRITLEHEIAWHDTAVVVTTKKAEDGTLSVTAYETTAGTRLWTQSLGLWPGVATVRRAGSNLFVVGRNEVVCLASQTGQRRYAVSQKNDLGTLLSTDGRRAYFGRRRGQLSGASTDGTPVSAFTDTGEVWRRSFDASFATPILWNDQLTVLLGTESGVETARLDRETGETLWRRPGRLIRTTGRGAFLQTDTAISRVETDGSSLWETDHGLSETEVKHPLGRILGGTFFTWSDRTLLGLDTKTGETVRRVSTVKPHDGVAPVYPSRGTPPTETHAIILASDRLLSFEI